MSKQENHNNYITYSIYNPEFRKELIVDLEASEAPEAFTEAPAH